jgi:hypothetical protein
MKMADIWFMANTAAQTFRNLFSVIAGVLLAAALFSLAVLVFLLLIASRVKGHGEETDLETMARAFDPASFLVIFTCCFSGGYCTGRISTRYDMIHGAITGVVSAFLLAYSTNFDHSTEAILYYAVIPPFTLTGTWLAARQKRKRNNRNNP